MRAINFLFILFFLLTIFLFSPDISSAQEKDSLPVVTVINPIRGSEWHGKADIFTSLKDQWKATQNAGVNATWLWQFTALEDDKMVNFARENMKNQEFGLFLEIDRNTAQKSGVLYRGQGPLYFSDGLFLVSYDVNERKKIIDTVFAKFKEKFGFYPKTVGAWWIGGDSLTYMQERYGIVAAMKAADQFDLDVYSIWGSPWSIPYIASKEHEGIPASSFNESSKVVILQWAPRDPLNGYANAKYSLQDFGIEGYGFSYVDYLSTIYLRKPLDNLNVGLENGGTFTQFESYYKNTLTGAKKLEKDKKVNIFLVKDYAEIFLSQKKIFANSDTNYFLSKDYKSEDQSFWYHSVNFKAGVHKVGEEIYLIDLHDYSNKVNEDFSLLNNSQGYLRVSTPSIIDSMRMPSSKLLIANSKEQMGIEEIDEVVLLVAGNRTIAEFHEDSLKIFPNQGEERIFTFDGKKYDKGIVINSLLPYFPLDKSTYFFVFLAFGLLTVGLLFLSIFLFKKTKSKKILFASFAGISIILIFLGGVVYLSRTTYVIAPFEMKALQVIKERKKNVIFIEEVDYGIRPIYKAVKPMLYVNYRFGEILTRTDWKIIERAENNVTKLSDHHDKVIVVPQYLGADFSNDEAKLNGLKKIFDNGQIAIFEMRNER